MWRSKAAFVWIVAVPVAVAWFTCGDGARRLLSDQQLASLAGGSTQKYCWPCENCLGVGVDCWQGTAECTYANQPCLTGQ